MNFIRQGFRKLSSDRHTCIYTDIQYTDRQTRPKLYKLTTQIRGYKSTFSQAYKQYKKLTLGILSPLFNTYITSVYNIDIINMSL